MDSIPVHKEDHETSLNNHFDLTPVIQSWPLPDYKCEYVDDVIGTIRTNDQNEHLISSDPLDDALDDFFTICGPLESLLESKEIGDWINLYIDNDLNE